MRTVITLFEPLQNTKDYKRINGHFFGTFNDVNFVLKNDKILIKSQVIYSLIKTRYVLCV